MNSVVGHATCCPDCQGSFDYCLEANEGGGLRYVVSCLACGDVYYDISALPVHSMPLAA